MMSNWKNFERRVAKIFGGARIPVNGRAELDIDHPKYGIECKYRKVLPDWLFGKAVKQALTGSKKCGKIPIVVIGKYNSSDIHVLMDIQTFLTITGENDVQHASSPDVS
jgi:hypothetical protein